MPTSLRVASALQHNLLQCPHHADAAAVVVGGRVFTHTPQPATQRESTTNLTSPISCVVLCSWHPQPAVVWYRGGVQRDGDRPAGSQPRGPVQLLQQEAHSEKRADAGGPDGEGRGLEQGGGSSC